MLWTNARGSGLPPGYDASGDVTNDGVNSSLYDAEGRLCATRSAYGGTMTGYLYGADGNRVAKGTIYTWSCDPSVNQFQVTTDYVLGLGGEQVTELQGGVWQHTNVFAGGTLLATYDQHGLHFHLSDPLGTRRAQTDYAGNLEQTCASLPFGDDFGCSSSDTSPTEQHFTGKERDTESGLDYFGARYYASSMGRFMSPDWSEKPEAVPYADLQNPQSLNLYSYAGNNPMSRTDPDGHCEVDGEKHGGAWCFFHSIGLAETQHEQANDLRSFYSGVSVYGADGNWHSVSGMTDGGILALNKSVREQEGAGHWGMAGAMLSIGADKLAHIYDGNAGDFGLCGNKNKEQLDKLQTAIAEHIGDPETSHISGQYRGQDADLHLNSRTQNVVVTGKDGSVIAGFKASPAQINYIKTTGRLN